MSLIGLLWKRSTVNELTRINISELIFYISFGLNHGYPILWVGVRFAFISCCLEGLQENSLSEKNSQQKVNQSQKELHIRNQREKLSGIDVYNILYIGRIWPWGHLHQSQIKSNFHALIGQNSSRNFASTSKHLRVRVTMTPEVSWYFLSERRFTRRMPEWVAKGERVYLRRTHSYDAGLKREKR